MADPFEEFEFRPLTEGLGFHRPEQTKAANTSLSTLQAPTNSAPASLTLNNSLPEIEMPLSSFRSTPTKAPASPVPPTSTVDDILKTLQSKRVLDFADQKQTSQGPIYRHSSPDFSSFILDGMLVVAGTLSCLIVLLMVTKVDLFAALTQSSDMGVYASLVCLFAGITWIYLVMNRVFMGFTPGEWVFDQRVGLPQKFGGFEYSLRILFRASLVILTGIFTLPILSVIFRQDFAGMISGASLLKKV